nr:flagellar hook-length control protein FliK [uncultured Treponema sp.]
MQTLDVQNDMQPARYAEAASSHNSEKKPVKEPEVKGSSFMDIIQKLMAEETDPHAVGQEAAIGMRDAADQSERKKNTAAQTALSRLKGKGGQQKADVRTPYSVEADAQAADSADALVDADALLAFEEGFDVKTALESGEEGALQTRLFAQAEADALPEEAVSMAADGLPLEKKQKNGKTEAGFAAAGLSVSGAAGTAKKQEAQADAADAAVGLEKNAKAPQIKQQKPVFTVIDERTVHAAPVTADGSVHEAGAAVRVSNAPSVDMAADFRSMAAGFGSAANGTQAVPESGAQSFSSLVAQQVQDMAPDFVQAGRIVLQDNNAGVIRLQMQPAHLGNVRINLELAGGKKVVGKIIAGSKEAYEAFKESIDQLAKAFELGGFSSAQFDVSWSGEGGGHQFGEENGQFNELFAQNDRLEVMQDNRYADTETVYAFGSDQAVNVFA